MYGEMLKNLREKSPLIHCITNYVTAGDCANILLACGASPIMADDPGESAEITAMCDGLVINIGTLSERVVPSMLSSGRQAEALSKVSVFDPVGAGASEFRRKTALELLDKLHFSVIRGNYSEIKTLLCGDSCRRGVDADDSKSGDGFDGRSAAALASELSERTGAVVVVTGETDVVADRSKLMYFRGGNPMMRSVTGTGCQLSALTAAFAAANPYRIADAAFAAAAAMGLCGEIAYERISPEDGNASYRNYIIDAVYRLTPEQLEQRLI